jgi:hypothetical protein
VDDITMEMLMIPEQITYNGRQLTSHWAYRNYHVLGDSIVSFQGPCQVTINEMVDLKDVLNEAPIYSEGMLHFIAEHYTLDLEQTILRQRLMIASLKDLITEKTNASLQRYGDDLFVKERKLSVSIATLTPVSTIIHTGVNITGRNAPVPAIGLAELGLDREGITALGESLCKVYVEEYHQIKLARCKVRGVD